MLLQPNHLLHPTTRAALTHLLRILIIVVAFAAARPAFAQSPYDGSLTFTSGQLPNTKVYDVVVGAGVTPDVQSEMLQVTRSNSDINNGWQEYIITTKARVNMGNPAGTVARWRVALEPAAKHTAIKLRLEDVKAGRHLVFECHSRGASVATADCHVVIYQKTPTVGEAYRMRDVTTLNRNQLYKVEMHITGTQSAKVLVDDAEVWRDTFSSTSGPMVGQEVPQPYGRQSEA